MIRQFASRQFLSFLMTGGIAAFINFASRIILNFWMSYSAAIIFAYLIGMLVAFLLSRLFVFTAPTIPLHYSALFFILVNLIAVIQTWLISMAMSIYILPIMNVNAYVPEIAHAAGVMLPAFTSFIGHKHWSFRTKPLHGSIRK